jgi:hypothetical protein
VGNVRFARLLDAKQQFMLFLCFDAARTSPAESRTCGLIQQRKLIRQRCRRLPMAPKAVKLPQLKVTFIVYDISAH